MAPISKKELMARLRKKRKEEDKLKWNESLLKDRERKKQAYHKNKLTLTEKEREINREKTRLKVQRHRMKKKFITNQNCSNTPKKVVYRTPQSLGKAVKKVVGSLPKSPSKQQAVIKRSLHLKDTCKELFKNKKEFKKEDGLKKK
ncbi:hypothetical protein J6590_086289, partial [Homalodisca vitripennis]